MKRRSVALALLLALIAVSASAEAPVRATDPAVFLPVVDANGARLSLTADPGTLLFKAATGEPLLAPDSHQITLGEWIGFSGTATIKCVAQGTHVNIQLRNLIPNGLYDVWIFGFRNQGEMSFLGALTSATRIPTAYTANHEGNLSVNAIFPGGPLSARGEISDCLLDNFFYAFTIVYHSDGRTYGPVPGPASVSLNHVFFDIFE